MKLSLWMKIVSVSLPVASAGFGAAMYLNRYALADTHVQLEQKVADHDSRISVVEELLKDIRREQEWQRNQLWRIAEKLGAAQVPAPKK